LTKNLDKKKSSDYLMKKYIISTKDRPGKDKLYGLDSRKIEKELKWHPKVSIDGGLKKTIDWIDDNLSYLKNLSMEYTHKK
jgi:dTDP-glucose 4,6-dehydratase